MAKKSAPGMVALIVTGLLLPRAVVLPKYPGSLNVLPSAICSVHDSPYGNDFQPRLSKMTIKSEGKNIRLTTKVMLELWPGNCSVRCK